MMPHKQPYCVGAPRPGKLLRRFYEPLILLWLLKPVQTPTETFPEKPQHSTSFFPLWKRFLDSLSWFCDPLPAGYTVSSVAAQDRPKGNCFWLASPHSYSLERLKQVLCVLETVSEKSDAEQKAITDDLTMDAIKFGRKRVETYCEKLAYEAREVMKLAQFSLAPPTQAQGRSPTDHTPSKDLLDAIQDISNTGKDPEVACKKACAFAHSLELKRLVDDSVNIDNFSRWGEIQRLISRLTTWHVAMRHVVSFAAKFPELLMDHTCESIRLPEPITLPKSDSKSNLRSALGRMLPKPEGEQITRTYDDLLNFKGYDLENDFAERIGSQKMLLKVHAEVYLMEHFYLNHFEFVYDYKYIGCSKPSCYCCHHYMRNHPGHFVVRKSHGTLWMPWSPPLLSRIEEDPIRKHNLSVMNRVVQHIREDVFDSIETQVTRRRRLADSDSNTVTDLGADDGVSLYG